MGVLAGVLLCGGSLLGCAERSAEEARARAALQEATALVTEAEAGFAPEQQTAYPEFRLAKLEEAAGRLNEVLGQGDDLAKAQAHQLLAGIEVTKAQLALRRAGRGFSDMSSAKVELLKLLEAVERINAKMIARGGDREAVLAALDEGAASIRQSKAGIASNLAELSAQREGAMLDAEKRNGEAAGSFTRGQEFEQQAFVAENDTDRNTAYQQAYEAQLAGQAAQRSAREAQIEADRLGAEIRKLQAESRLWDQMATQVAEMRERAQTAGDAASRDVTTAGSDKELGLAAVREKYDQLNNLYVNHVDAALGEARERLERAVEHHGQAERLAEGAGKRSAQFDRLAVQVDLAHVLSRHAQYARDFAGTAEAVAGNPVVTDTPIAQAIATRHQQVAEQAETLRQQTGELITAAIEQAQPLVGESELGQATASLTDSLRVYDSQIN
jgi:hypothetical protein